MDTITAISTAPGTGGIGIIRISGKETFNIIKKIFKPKTHVENIKGNTIKYGHIVDNFKVIDEVLVSFFVSPNSYTTEDMCEINTHGGSVIMQKILELCIKNGAVLAEAGEFTKRAFLNGRIDLSQAEAVIDIINAKTQKEAESSINQLEGFLSKKIEEIEDEILEVLSDIEANIDYPEYDIEEMTNKKTLEKLKKIEDKLILLTKTFTEGKIIKEGIKTAIIGRPNARKIFFIKCYIKRRKSNSYRI